MRSALRAASVIAGLVGGLGGLYLGGFLLAAWYDLDGRRADVAALPSFADAAPGERATLEGTVAERTPELRGEFVLYRRRHRPPGAQTGAWNDLGGEAQPLWIDTAGETVHLANEDYTLDAWAGDAWAALERPDAGEGASATSRIRGFARGSRLFAVGVVEREGGERVLLADSVCAGPLDAYLADLDARASGYRLWGLLFLGAGALLLFLGVWQGLALLRGLRPATEPEPEPEPEDAG